MKAYAVDTNIILQDIANLYKISDKKSNIILISEIVLIEIEDKKKLFSDIGYQARAFSRLLASLDTVFVKKEENFTLVRKENSEFIIDFVFLDSYKKYELSEANDKKILEGIEAVKKFYKETK